MKQNLYTGGGQGGKLDIKELEILKKVVHTHIIKLHEIIDDPQSKKLYIVMDYLPGGTLLQKLMETEAGFSDEEARIYFSQLISALHYCHEVKNFAHRDVKPENIMLDEHGKLILCDFGVSQFFTADNDVLQGTFGTVRFMAPEMLGISSKPVLHGRSIDIWAAGVTLYYMKTKQYPFDGKTLPAIRD